METGPWFKAVDPHSPVSFIEKRAGKRESTGFKWWSVLPEKKGGLLVRFGAFLRLQIVETGPRFKTVDPHSPFSFIEKRAGKRESTSFKC